jgi:hypothetical protein
MDMTTLFDFLAIKVDSITAAKLGDISLNVVSKANKDEA